MTSTSIRSAGAPVARGANDPTASAVNVGSYERVASLVGGPLLALYGLSRGAPAGFALVAAGSVLLYRGWTGHCPVYQALGLSSAPAHGGALHVEKSVTINRPAEDLYAYWRNFAHLPRFMKHLERVTVEDDCSRWVARGPAGTTVAWDAEITADQPGRMICWRALPNAQVDSEGCVQFEPAPGDRGTVVKVAFDYRPPAGAVGAAVAWLFGEEPNQQVAGDLRRFKNIMEAGEIPTTEGQSAGPRSAIGKLLKPEHKPAGADDAAPSQARSTGDSESEQPKKPFQPRKPPVTEASEESFPASDPPAWIGNVATGKEKEIGA